MAKNIHDIIRSRRSCRSFDSRPLETGHRAELEKAIREDCRDHLGKPIHMALVDRKAPGSGVEEKLGTYGVIKGAANFLVGSFPAGGERIEGFGYAFEGIVLKATALGIGSCWLAGTLDRVAFGRVLGLSAKEVIPAISPLGYPVNKSTIADRFIRFAAGSDHRLAWESLFIDADSGRSLSAQEAGPYAPALSDLRLAPSASNKQPWRLSRLGKTYRFLIKRSLGYGSAFSFDIQRLDIGIAMKHFELSARAEGLEGSWHYENSLKGIAPDCEYIVSWTEGRA